jgi:DNA-binding response OmpR family regulator
MTRQPVAGGSPPAGLSAIMVVEPEILVRMVIAEYLRNCGYKVIEAGTADDAVAVLRSDFKVELVLAEVHGIGAMDGFSLAKEIRLTYPEVDVILTSGVANAADKSHALCEGRVVKKPYKPEDIVRQINVLRERRRSSKM